MEGKRREQKVRWSNKRGQSQQSPCINLCVFSIMLLGNEFELYLNLTKIIVIILNFENNFLFFTLFINVF